MNFQTPLCELAYKYKTDKCPQIHHFYTTFYYELFKDSIESVKKVVEIGIGHPDQFLTDDYRIGASLKMWRDFFPNAQIYGADILPSTMFQDNRIETILCDETKTADLENLIKHTGSDIDLFIDDGLHARGIQINTCLTLMPLLQDKVVYVIEDIYHPQHIMRRLGGMYSCELIEGIKRRGKRSSDKLIIVRKINK
jgi:hypothetical protein